MPIASKGDEPWPAAAGTVVACAIVVAVTAGMAVASTVGVERAAGGGGLFFKTKTTVVRPGRLKVALPGSKVAVLTSGSVEDCWMG